MSNLKSVLKRFLKRTFASFIYYTAIWKIIKKYKCRNSCFLLMYHRIIAEADIRNGKIQSGMYVSASSFRMQIDFLKKHFQIISLSDLIRLRKNREDLSNKCVITFDDGWRDNYDNALPVLNSFNVPATIFVITEFITNKKRMWTDIAYLRLKHILRVKNSGDIIEIFKNLNLPLTIIKVGNDIDDTIEDIIDFLKTRSEHERMNILSQLHEVSKPHEQDILTEREFLNVDEIAEMRKLGFEFGSHTNTHKILTNYQTDVVHTEICQSKQILTQLLNHDIKFFCYPNGNYSTHIVDEVKKCSYDAACSTIKKYVNHSSDLFLLPRIGLHNDISDNIPMFVCRILLIPGF